MLIGSVAPTGHAVTRTVAKLTIKPRRIAPYGSSLLAVTIRYSVNRRIRACSPSPADSSEPVIVDPADAADAIAGRADAVPRRAVVQPAVVAQATARHSRGGSITNGPSTGSTRRSGSADRVICRLVRPLSPNLLPDRFREKVIKVGPKVVCLSDAPELRPSSSLAADLFQLRLTIG
jgi:hypothetical protein